MSVVPHQASLVPEPEPGLLAMIERVAVNPEVSVDKLERLLAIQERVMSKQAEDDFNVAMSAAQSEMGRVSTDAENPQTRSRYASYGKLDRALRPIYTRHGFALSFDEADSPKANHLRVICHVSHRGGHTRVYRRDLPVITTGLQGKANMTETHGNASAQSYAMRYLLKGIFNVAIGEDDNDGNAPTVARITEKEAADVEALIEEVGADKAKFLKFYKIASVAELPKSDLAGAVAELRRRGAKK